MRDPRCQKHTVDTKGRGYRDSGPQQARMQRPAVHVDLALASALAIVAWGPASELVSAAVRTSVSILFPFILQLCESQGSRPCPPSRASCTEPLGSGSGSDAAVKSSLFCGSVLFSAAGGSGGANEPGIPGPVVGWGKIQSSTAP